MSYASIVERGERPVATFAPARRVSPAPAPPEILTIPPAIYRRSFARYERNRLVILLVQHFGRGVTDELLKRFQIGTSAYWEGACIFWLLDIQGRIRAGQIVLFDETGHTVKEPKRHTNWVHRALLARYNKERKAAPLWLIEYNEQETKNLCLYGLSQLADAPLTQPIAIVESPKTAIIATPYLPQYIWLSIISLSYLTADRLEVLRGRRIVLFPDAGAFSRWNRKAEKFRRMYFDIVVSADLEQLATPAERKAGLDLADVLLREWNGYPPNWDDLSE